MNETKNTISALLWATISEVHKTAALVGLGILDNGAAYIDVDNVSFSEKDFDMYEKKVSDVLQRDISLSDVQAQVGKDVPLADPSTLQSVAFKIFSVSGAYIDGDENNKMVTRLRLWIFPTQQELDTFLKEQEEQSEYDHRKLNDKLKFFAISEVVGKGLPLYTEKGATLKRVLEQFIVNEEMRRGYTHVSTPEITSVKLYEKSGHLHFYKDSMYPAMEVDGEQFMLRPMTCPHHFELFLSEPKSYKDLPLRIAEIARLYRYERSGELTGLTRVRGFALSDAHIFCADADQAKEEVASVLDFIEYINTKIFGLEPNKDYWYRLSLGDETDEKKYAQSEEVTVADWKDAEQKLREVLQAREMTFVEAEGEAAFYGPKIDIQMRSVTGKEDTAFTVQWDFLMPKRFNLAYVGTDGKQHESIVIHRSSIGATERLIAFLIEKYRGAFPFWLSPIQVRVLTVTDTVQPYAQEILESLSLAGIRADKDFSDDKLGGKLHNAKAELLPYMLIIGEKDMEKGVVTLESKSGEKHTFTKEELVKFLSEKNIPGEV